MTYAKNMKILLGPYKLLNKIIKYVTQKILMERPKCGMTCTKCGMTCTKDAGEIFEHDTNNVKFATKHK